MATTVLNDTLLYEVINKASIGLYVNQFLYLLGGIGGLTLIYVSIMMYLQWKQYVNTKQELYLQTMELVLLHEQYKMIREIHKNYKQEQHKQHNGQQQNR